MLAACHSGQQPVTQNGGAAPHIEMTSPSAGDWLVPGEVQVSGNATDVAKVTVNGTDAGLAKNGTFVGRADRVRGANAIEARGTTRDGQDVWVHHGVLAGRFADPDGPVLGALQVRVNQGGIDRALERAGSLIDPSTVEDAALAMNPVYQDAYGVFGWDAVTIEADLTGLSFSTPEPSAHPAGGNLALEVEIPDLVADTHAFGTAVGIDFSVAGPAAGSVSLFTALLARLLLREAVGSDRLVLATVVVGGVALLASS